MRKSRFTEEPIIGIPREHEAGAKLTELCRRHNVSPTTIYKWRAKFDGMTVSDAKRLKGLQDENRRLKQLLADAMLDNQALKGLLAKNW
jgi:putative transposase